jgi:putative flippase GtrA
MNFEELQKSWKTQPVKIITDPGKLKGEFEGRWHKHQQKVLRTNICMTLGFIAAMLVMAWVYITYQKEFHWPFKVSLATAYILMIIFSAVSWQSYAFKKENFEDSSDVYIGYQLKKLNWQRKLITYYSWIYVVLLWLAMVMYIWEITARGTATFRFSALAVTSAYIFGITWWNKRKKEKKQLGTIDSMAADLKDLQDKITAVN